MTISLFFSVFFHLLIIFSFLVFPNLFNLKKKSKVSEIPIEIVEISKQTQSKKVKIKKVSEKNQNYTPPKAIKKPKAPEFIKKQKKEKIKNKLEEKKIVEERKKMDRLSSIFNSIDEIKKKNIDRKKEEKKEEKREEIKSNLIGEKLSISEIDLIRSQFIPCWTIPAGAKGLSSLVIKVNLKLDNEGNVVSSKIINKYNLKNPSHRTLAESVIRAIKHPSCKKIRVPSKKYDIWKNITLNFDPSEIESQ